MPKGRATKAKSLHVESMSKVKGIDSILSNGCTTIVVILADWCGACKRVKPMWLNALKKEKKNNLMLINNEVLPKTPLNSLNITHFPSTFKIPSGGTPTLLDNPQDKNDIENTLNSTNLDEDEDEDEDEDKKDEVEDKAPGLNPITASQYVSMRNTRMNDMNNTNQNIRTIKSMNRNTILPSQRKTNRNTILPSQRKTNRNGSMSLKIFTPRNGFTPSLEKLKGGRRTRKRRS